MANRPIDEHDWQKDCHRNRYRNNWLKIFLRPK